MSKQNNLERHKRHILLKEVGGPGVQKLSGAAVSIVGAGALGGPCALYLAAAGIGRIQLIDDDLIERSNLQRQVQFTESDLGRSKAVVLAGRLEAMNSAIEVSALNKRFQTGDILSGDVLVDATDNYPTRFALNALAHQSGRAMVHGAAARWTGQASVFTSGLGGGAPCYRCWVPEAPPEAETCERVGVAGPVTGLVGTRMALEVIKLITGAGTPLIGLIWLFNGLNGDSKTVRLRNDPDCPDCQA